MALQITPKRLFSSARLKTQVRSDTCERLLLTTRKQVHHLSERHLVAYLVFFQLVLYVLCYSLCILSNCIHIVASSLFPYLNFRFPCLSWNITLLFPFRYPMKLHMLIFGGISTNMCTWSGQISAIDSLSIFPISTRYFCSNIFLLYFGANTIWYLQFHVVCAKLLLSFI